MKIKMLMAFVALLLFSAFTADRTITIFMIGDSTMANKPLEGGNQERGWGHVLGGYFSENIRVENHARNGRSSKSFIDEGLWEVVINKVKPGDYVFIQFGHNDEKADEKRHTDPGSTFDANLRRFVKETRAKGGIPVLFNAIVRRNFRNNKNAVAEDDVRKDLSKGSVSQDGEVLIDIHGKYLESPRNVAKELDVPFVDMNKITHDLVQEMGPEASKKLFMWIPEGVCAACPKGREDNTHLNVYGARTIAGLTVDAIAKEVPALAPFVRHYDFVVAKDGSGDFFTIQEAIHAVPDFRKAGRTTILVRKGVYKEKVVIPESKISVSLIGEDGAILTMMILLLKRTISEKKCLPPVHQPVISMLPISMLRISLSRIVPAEWGRQWPVLLVEIALISKTVVFGEIRILCTLMAKTVVSFMTIVI